MKEIWLILACVPLYVVNAFCDKAVSAQKGNTYNFLYNAIKFFVGSLLLLPMLLMDKAPKLEGRNMSMFLSPKPTTPPKKPAKPKTPKTEEVKAED